MRLSGLSASTVLAATAAVLTACAGVSAPGSASNKVRITSSDSECTVAKTELRSGELVFDVVNLGTKATEVDVYGQQGGAFTRVLSEVENIAPGKSADLVVRLGGGTYEIACKPGQTGEGIRQRIVITGKPGPSASPAVGYDREVQVEFTGAAASGMDDLAARPGETISFRLENDAATGTAYLEIIGPDGQELGEITGVPPGQHEAGVIKLAGAGQYTWRVGDHASGTFTVK